MDGSGGDTCVPRQSREEEKGRLTGGPGRGKKQFKFEIRNKGVSGLKKFTKFLLEIDKITKNTMEQESLKKLL